ncbi:molecular chaperone HscB [Alphaproteobacteria bacterium]
MTVRRKSVYIACPHCKELIAGNMLFCPLCKKIQPIQDMVKDNCYALFDIEESPIIDLIKLQDKVFEKLGLVHPDRFINGSVLEKKIALENAALYNRAYKILVSPLLRMEYILNKHGYKAEAPEGLLIESFAWHENLVNAKDQEGVYKMQKDFEQLHNFLIMKIIHLITTHQYEEACDSYTKLRFVIGFQKEIFQKCDSF